jgi:hypothetical protein
MNLFTIRIDFGFAPHIWDKKGIIPIVKGLPDTRLTVYIINLIDKRPEANPHKMS